MRKCWAWAHGREAHGPQKPIISVFFEGYKLNTTHAWEAVVPSSHGGRPPLQQHPSRRPRRHCNDPYSPLPSIASSYSSSSPIFTGFFGFIWSILVVEISRVVFFFFSGCCSDLLVVVVVVVDGRIRASSGCTRAGSCGRSKGAGGRWRLPRTTSSASPGCGCPRRSSSASSSRTASSTSSPDSASR